MGGQFFNATLQQTVDAFKPKVGHAGPTTTEEGKKEIPTITETQAIARIIITILLIFLSVYLFEKSTDTNSYSEIASGLIGAITGYWLR